MFWVSDTDTNQTKKNTSDLEEKNSNYYEEIDVT
jgi:hypothetical protein